MQWKRLVLVALVVLLQGLAEARSRRNTTRTRQNRRTQERFRPVESRLSDNQGDVEPLAPPHHSLRQQHAYRGQHGGRVRHFQGRHHGHHHTPHHAHHPQQLAADHHECPNCYQLEMRKKLRLAQIKDRVLTATGLINPPNMTGVVLSSNPDVQGIIQTMEVPTAYLQEPLYNEDEPDVKTEMLFFPVQPAPPDLNIPEGTDVLYFNLSRTPLGNRAKRAILHVWLKPTVSELLRQLPVSIFKVSRPQIPGGEIEKKSVTTVMESFNPYEGNWVKIEIYQLLQEWLTRPEENLGLVVEALDSQGQQVAVTDPQESPSNAPLLEIHTEDSNRSRSRRNSGNFMCTNENESRCCRYHLTVNFVEMGWDFIVAPKVYEANFCNGECPFLYAHKYAHTALIQKMNSTNAQHGPCCGARKLSPMKMLYYDHDHMIKFDIINDMVVDRCGCS
ncbi:growth/differentiation factor 8-like isoform X3 [Portunus trituberculatus]|uniref:growth/differentiation factor 8-like isoform X3 n=1 Tax=Portunus trituberculatus TaxID=210409 RepID=UPI001E1CCD67|nr:growth/differentiation factor 8-like isoform X3 [Portunus trituberculatus]